MNTLLHMCCAPCSIECVNSLKNEKIEIDGLWYNPNIHPFTEYKNRLDALINYASEINLKLHTNNTYGLKNFITNLNNDFSSPNRCRLCYNTRLEYTAKFASENHYDSFTTSLLISPYQNHNLIISLAEEYAKKYKIQFLYKDFRPLFREGQKNARTMNFYMQKYCGCIFSEEDRYIKQ